MKKGDWYGVKSGDQSQMVRVLYAPDPERGRSPIVVFEDRGRESAWLGLAEFLVYYERIDP